MLRVVIILAAAFGLLVATGFEQADAATHKKRKHSGKKKAAVRPGKTASTHKSAGKAGHKAIGKSAHKSGKSSNRKGGKRRSRKSSAPARVGQRAPLPERYREIQEALISKGYLKTPATGEWDAESIAAMKRFQADQKLTPDGKIGSLSLIALGLGSRNSRITNSSPTPVRLPQ